MKIKHICISSGGYAGLYGLGALEVLQENSMYSYSDLSSVYGTSIGSVLLLILLLDIDWKDVIHYITKRPWYKLIDITNIFHLYETKGIFHVDLFYAFYEPLFKMKQYDLSMTFIELYEKTNISFHVFTTDVSTIKYRECSHITSPNMKVIDAVYMSSSIPIVFEPLWYDNTYYIDGAFHIYDPTIVCQERNMGEKDNILSIVFKRNKDIVFEKDMNFLNYLRTFVFNIMQEMNKQNVVDDKDKHKHVLYIPFDDISIDTLNEILQEESLRKQYVQKGRDYTKVFLKYKQEEKTREETNREENTREENTREENTREIEKIHIKLKEE